MSYYIVDVESDGPAAGLYSMVCFGIVKVTRSLDQTFYGQTAPLVGAKYDPKALAVSKFTRAQHEQFPEPGIAMTQFLGWISADTDRHKTFISDNLAFDWSFFNYYCHAFLGQNPFGWSGRRIGDLYCGMVKNGFAQWKFLRKTKHTHHPVDDAKGNAEALIHMVDQMGLDLGRLA